MKRMLTLAGLSALLFALAGEARAQSPDAYLFPCDSQPGRGCRETASAFKRDFQRAMSGDLEGVRAISMCLATSCGGVVIENRIQACAWRLLTLGAKPANPDDAAFFKSYCRERLTTAELTVASERAKDLNQRVFRRPLVAQGF